MEYEVIGPFTDIQILIEEAKNRLFMMWRPCGGLCAVVSHDAAGKEVVQFYQAMTRDLKYWMREQAAESLAAQGR